MNNSVRCLKLKEKYRGKVCEYYLNVTCRQVMDELDTEPQLSFFYNVEINVYLNSGNKDHFKQFDMIKFDINY